MNSELCGDSVWLAVVLRSRINAELPCDCSVTSRNLCTSLHSGEIAGSRHEARAHDDTLCRRNFHILLFIVSRAFDVGQPPVPSLTSAGSYLQHLRRDNAMNGFSHPTKTLKAARTHCRLPFLLFLSFFSSSFFLRLLLSPRQRHGNTGDECRQRKS